MSNLGPFTIHNVRSIRVEYQETADKHPTRWISLFAQTDDKEEYEISMFVEGPIPINGADLLSMMAAGEGS